MRNENNKPEKFYSIAALIKAGHYNRCNFYRFIKTGQLKVSRRGKGKFLISEKNWLEFCSEVVKKDILC